MSALGRKCPLALTVFGSAHDRVGIGTDCATDKYELRDIQAALTELELRDEGLASPNPLAQLDLRDSRVLSSRHEQRDHFTVEV